MSQKLTSEFFKELHYIVNFEFFQLFSDQNAPLYLLPLPNIAPDLRHGELVRADAGEVQLRRLHRGQVKLGGGGPEQTTTVKIYL